MVVNAVVDKTMITVLDKRSGEAKSIILHKEELEEPLHCLASFKNRVCQTFGKTEEDILDIEAKNSAGEWTSVAEKYKLWTHVRDSGINSELVFRVTFKSSNTLLIAGAAAVAVVGAVAAAVLRLR